MSASMRRAGDGSRKARGRGCAKFSEQSREIAVDVRHGADFAEVVDGEVPVHSAEPEKHTSIASMHSRVGASW